MKGRERERDRALGIVFLGKEDGGNNYILVEVIGGLFYRLWFGSYVPWLHVYMIDYPYYFHSVGQFDVYHGLMNCSDSSYSGILDGHVWLADDVFVTG